MPFGDVGRGFFEMTNNIVTLPVVRIERMEDEMTREQAIAELKDCQTSGDTEATHSEADEVLCKFLIALGYQDIVDEWEKVDKWYA
jgi:hypothetical protein